MPLSGITLGAIVGRVRGVRVGCSDIVDARAAAGLPGRAAYHASKHGVIGLTRSAALEYAPRGAYKTVGCPIKLSDSPAEIKPPPHLGEHTDEVLREAGLSDEEMAALRN